MITRYVSGPSDDEQTVRARENTHSDMLTHPAMFLGATVYLYRKANLDVLNSHEGNVVTTVTGIDRRALPIFKEGSSRQSREGAQIVGWEACLLTPHGKVFVPGGKGEKVDFYEWLVEKIDLR